MEKLLSCPECGNQPKLSSLEPEYKSMKYFCGVHVSCGDWKETEELAVTDWNKRVQEYKIDRIIADVSISQHKYVLVFPDEDSIQLYIDQNINRPNNPDDYEIISEYVSNNYGHKVYEVVSLDDIEKVRIK